MRTTISIADDLLALVAQRAAEQGTTVSQVIDCSAAPNVRCDACGAPLRSRSGQPSTGYPGRRRRHLLDPPD